MRRVAGPARRTLSVITSVLGIISLVLTGPSARVSAQAPAARVSAPGELLVKFRPGVSASVEAAAHRSAGATPLGAIARTRVTRVRVPVGSETSALARYQGNPNVLYAEPNFLRRLPAAAADKATSSVAPTDALFTEQWALNNTGQSFYCLTWFLGDLCFYAGTPDADIDASEAWAISKGTPAVTVAVIDSGVDYTHPDLAANYAGGDDFTSPDGDPMDDNGHGTHVAGTIAAAMGNLTGTPGSAEGVVGVAPNVRFTAYKVCLADGTCDDFAVQEGIARAIADGAKVINMSLGGHEYSQSLNDAVQDAWNAGLVVVAGAGNDGTTDLFYPAALDNVVSVGAFDEDDQRASFSNYGSWVDIAAPGSTILSTYPMSSCASSTTPGSTGCYTWLSGTSMATPHVAGAAALVWSRGDVTTNQQIVDILLTSADGKGVAGARLDSWTSHGGLNLYDAMIYGLDNLPPAADAGPDQTLTDTDGDGSELAHLDGTASSDRDGAIVSYEWREGPALIATGATASVWLPVGDHTLTLEVTDDGGATASDVVIVAVNHANQVTVTATQAQAAEAGPVSGAFLVARTGSTSAPLTVRFTVTGTATSGADYVALSSSVTIPEGATSASVPVTPIDDVAYESAETVVLTLDADPAYSLGAPVQAVVAIASDDLPPDLVVSTLGIPSQGAADADIVVTDTTANKGTGSSPASRTAFYLSLNGTLDAADILLGSRIVTALAAGASDAKSATVHVPASTATGMYYVFAKADDENAIAESTETNNVKATGLIMIGPDLVLSGVSAPASAAAGGSLTLTDTTRNQGGGGADASATSFYLSVNTVLDSGDVLLGSRAVPSLSSGGTSSGSVVVALPSATPAGTYFVLGKADGPNALKETNENNNTRVSNALKVGPDLVVTSVTAPSTGTPGLTLTVSSGTTNQGAATAPTSSTGFYLSSDLTIGPTDTFLGSYAVGALTPGATGTAVVGLQVPAGLPTGTYYIVARADWNGAVAEATESNNDRASGAIRIGPDLAVTAISTSSAGTAGGAITVVDTTANQSAAAVPQSVTAFYLSTDFAYKPTSDVYLGSRTVPPLGASGASTASTSLVIPAGTAPGSYYVIGVADWSGVIAESSESNNTRSSGAVRVGPDLVIASANGPWSAVAGASITISDTTANQGGDAAAASVNTYYLSVNTIFDAGDVLLGTRAVPALSPGASSAGSVVLTIPASTPAGTWCIVVVADGGQAVAEAVENNNSRARVMTLSAAP